MMVDQKSVIARGWSTLGDNSMTTKSEWTFSAISLIAANGFKNSSVVGSLVFKLFNLKFPGSPARSAIFGGVGSGVKKGWSRPSWKSLDIASQVPSYTWLV
jgi:hypothetical protein